MRTIKELIDFARANPQFFTKEFTTSISKPSISFGRGNYIVNCETGEIYTTDKDRTDEEIERKIFNNIKDKMTAVMIEVIKAACIPHLKLIYNCLKDGTFPIETNFIIYGREPLIKVGAAGVDVKNQNVFILSEKDDTKDFGHLASFLAEYKRVISQPECQKLVTIEIERTAQEARTAKHKRRQDLESSAKDPEQKSSALKRKDKEDLRREVLLKSATALKHQQHNERTSTV